MLSHDGSFDGLALDLRDNVYAAANIQNKIVRVARDGSITTIAAAPADPLVFPSAIAFETSFGLQKRIYITNFAGPAAVLFTAHNTTLSFEDASIKEMTVIIGGQKVVLGPGSLGYVPRNTVHEFKVTGKQVCHCLNYYTPAGFEQALLGCSRPAERRELPPPGLDPPDSPHVVRFFNNYWCAPASLLWATQKWSRG